MTARAQGVEATRTGILDASVELAETRPLSTIGLDDVAELAGVSVQTVLRHFGTRAGLFETAVAHATGAVQEERRTPVGDVASAVRVIVDHYEARGAASLLFLAQEGSEPLAARVTSGGRALHRTWVSEAFAPLIPARAEDRDAAVDLLVVATDVYTWKLLRKDRGLSRAHTQQRMERLVRAVLADLGETGRTHH